MLFLLAIAAVSVAGAASLVYYQTSWFFMPRNQVPQHLHKHIDDTETLYPHPEGEI